MDVREIEIKRDQRSAFTSANFDHSLVGLTAQSLLNNRMGIVSSGDEYLRQRGREVLVKFEVHAALVNTTRSRANSAAYAIAAATSSRCNVG